MARDIYDWGSSAVGNWYDTNFTSQGSGPSGQPYAPLMNNLGSDEPLLNVAVQNYVVAPLYNLAAETWNAAWRVQSGDFSDLDLLSTAALATPGSQAFAPALEYGTSKLIPFLGKAGPYVDDFVRGLYDATSILRDQTGSIGYVDDVASKSIRHGPMNPGPLADDIANTFRSGSYTARTIDKPTTMYRVISDTGNPTGSYWTSVKPKGPLQSVIDSALDQNWGNTATRVVKAEIPAGTKIYEGAAAVQRGLVGGGNQVYIPKVDPKWIVP